MKKILVVGHTKYMTDKLAETLSKDFHVTKVVADSMIAGLRGWFKNLTKRHDKVLCVASSNTHFVLPFFFSSREKYYFPYDIVNFYALPPFKGISSWIKFQIDKLLENIIFLLTDKIVHKGSENELRYLKIYPAIKKKKHYVFREFLIPSLIQKKKLKKISERDGSTHLVYGGCIHTYDDFFHERTTNLFDKIAKQKIHIHFYAYGDKKRMDYFRNYAKSNENSRYIHYEGSRTQDQLLKEYTKYDYGVYLYGRDDNMFGGNGNNIWDNTGFSNKIFDYMHAGLPIIYSTNIKAVASFLEQLDVGIGIPYENVLKLSEALKKVSKGMHKRMQSNIIKYFNEYKIDKFVRFIEG
ncbi:hypothetical protein H6503_00980 [Candidatus Woesearchaeota archaeon]|nr:hypothetical protein [Candidatus Woesearchaeota archaeon]